MKSRSSLLIAATLVCAGAIAADAGTLVEDLDEEDDD